MPTYAYRCPSCGHEFQKFHKMSVRTRPKCPACGTVAQRVITGGVGLHFKGSGFYATDYPKKGSKAPEGQEGQKKAGDKKPEAKKPSAKQPGDDH
jgi:putative FmdB family regulatory protein